jgi:diguanylate cyclase (GGDEF)-like protein/PAS domain S-box-containing protein
VVCLDFQLINHIPFPIFLYKDKIIAANSAFLELTGYELGEVLDQEVWKFFDEQFQYDIKKAVKRVLINDLPSKEYPMRILTKADKSKWVLIGTSTLSYQDEYIGFATLFDLTNKIQLEELLEKDRFWEDIFNQQSAIMLLIDYKTGEIVDANPAAEKFYKYSTNQLKRMKINEINTLSKKQIYTKMNNAMERKENEFFFEHKLANGEIRNVQVYTSEVIVMGRKLLFSIIYDVTDRVLYEDKLLEVNAKLEESQQKYKSLFSNNPNISFTLDEKGRITQINDVVEEVLGYSHEVMINKKLYCFLNKHHRKEVRDAFEKVLNGEAVHIITDAYHCDGIVVNIKITAVPILLEDNVAGIIGIIEDITEKRKLEEQLKRLSYLDGLTGIYNRRYFNETLENYWYKALYDQQQISLILFDIDHFKVYNDTYGHLLGDECLKTVTTATQSVITESTSFLARYGGEEFSVITLFSDDLHTLQTAERIRSTIEALNIPNENSKVKPILTVSVGVVTLVPSEDITITDLIEMADTALYKAKNTGRNKVVEYCG